MNQIKASLILNKNATTQSLFRESILHSDY